MPMTETLAEAIEVMRAACADNDEALLYLEEIEESLVASPVAERQKLAAWNAWAAQ